MKKLLTGLVIGMQTVVLPYSVAADPVANVSRLNIAQPDNNAGLNIIQYGVTSESTSTGGAVNLNNTSNPGAGMVIYTNQAAPTGHLFSTRVDNPTFNKNAMYAVSSGINHTMSVLYTGQDPNSSAGNFVSANPYFTTLQVTGQELNRGTIKVSHTGTGADGSAAAISIDLKGSRTAAQGLYINATEGGTTGKLIHVQNNTSRMFVVNANGKTEIKSDVELLDSNAGVIIKDRTKGTRYRIFVNNGLIGVEPAN
jgi:hypothetical protein